MLQREGQQGHRIDLLLCSVRLPEQVQSDMSWSERRIWKWDDRNFLQGFRPKGSLESFVGIFVCRFEDTACLPASSLQIDFLQRQMIVCILSEEDAVCCGCCWRCCYCCYCYC